MTTKSSTSSDSKSGPSLPVNQTNKHTQQMASPINAINDRQRPSTNRSDTVSTNMLATACTTINTNGRNWCGRRTRPQTRTRCSQLNIKATANSTNRSRQTDLAEATRTRHCLFCLRVHRSSSIAPVTSLGRTIQSSSNLLVLSLVAVVVLILFSSTRLEAKLNPNAPLARRRHEHEWRPQSSGASVRHWSVRGGGSSGADYGASQWTKVEQGLVEMGEDGVSTNQIRRPSRSTRGSQESATNWFADSSNMRANPQRHAASAAQPSIRPRNVQRQMVSANRPLPPPPPPPPVHLAAASGRSELVPVAAPLQSTPAAGAAVAQKCALILQRTYVRRLSANDLDGGPDNSYNNNNNDDEEALLEPTGRQERVCITYEHVNKAIAEAKQKRAFRVTDELMMEVNSIEPHPPFIAQLGELNQEVTKILALKFDLSSDEILNGLPLIDMSRTNFWPICPLMVKPIECDPTGRFRSFTGHCNNLKNPAWGAAQTPFVRFLAPKHPDGIEKDRVSALDGSPLPPPRLITSMVHRDQEHSSSDLSLLIMVWGQALDHDVALAAPPRDENGMDFNCCKRRHPNCKPIQIPDNDPLYARFNQKCMDFKRSLAGLRPNCALGPRVHINTITATIDANTIYGSTKEVADQLRTFSGGLLKVQDVFRNMNLKPLMPKQLQRPDLDCFERPQNVYCFLGGDERVNEQPTLTVMHTIYVRDHNRIASQLSQLNPHWDDDRIYHETRHIEAAIIQHLLINEYLPLLIGHDMMLRYNLTSAPPNTYWNGYNPEVTPSISQGFSTAAFRQGHTFIQGQVRLHDSRTHNYVGSILLRNLFKRPFHYYQPGRMDQVLAGIINTPAQSYDPFITEEISGHLFQEAGEAFGMDLPAINLARGREQGVPGYNHYREWCGLPRARSFEDLQPDMANSTAYLYSKLYKHVDDIDLWSGGVCERPMAGAQIGPTFACIIARQFANIKRGDRFWFENGGLPSSFTLDQLREIKKATQARLICYNSDNMLTIQRNALKLPHPIYNPRVRCSDIPDLDLNFWREDPSSPGSFLTSYNET